MKSERGTKKMDSVLSEKELKFLDLVKSRMTASDTQEDLEAVIFPAVLSLDGESDNPIFEAVLEYVEKNANLTLKQISDYIYSILPPIEIVDDEKELA